MSGSLEAPPGSGAGMCSPNEPREPFLLATWAPQCTRFAQKNECSCSLFMAPCNNGTRRNALALVDSLSKPQEGVADLEYSEMDVAPVWVQASPGNLLLFLARALASLA